jgi:hypothetical protein
VGATVQDRSSSRQLTRYMYLQLWGESEGYLPSFFDS